MLFEVVDTREGRHFGRGWRGLLGIARALEARPGRRAAAFARGEATPKMRRDGLARFAEEFFAGTSDAHATCERAPGLTPEEAVELIRGASIYGTAAAALCPAPLSRACRIVSGWTLNDPPAGWAGSYPHRDGAWDWQDFGPPDDLLDIYELSSSCVEEVAHA